MIKPDQVMKLIYNKVFLEHTTPPGHFENRKRLESLGHLPETEIISGEPYLDLVHTETHIEKIKEACKNSAMIDADTFAVPKSYDAAIHAVGAAIMASQTHDFAIVKATGTSCPP